MAASSELLLGSQVPTHRLVPTYDFSRGDEAIEIGEIASYRLDEWQQEYLRDSLGVVVIPSPLEADEGREVERWAAFEVFVELSRQNGKSVVKEVRAIAGIYVFHERRVVYSAHKLETVNLAQQRIIAAIQSDPELKGEVRTIRTGNNDKVIEFYSGQSIRFKTRTTGGGRGLDGDCVILDESQDLNDDHVGALMPVVSARPNPQLWYGGSAGGQKSTVQAGLVRGCMNRDPGLVAWRFAASEDDPPASEQTWARVNPAYGRRIAPSTILAEHNRMSRMRFGKERLGIGDYPRAEGEEWVIPRRRWERAEDPDSQAVGPVVFAVELSWNMLNASIGAAGWRADGARHLEVLANEHGTVWAVEELKRLTKAHKNLGVVLDPGGPAAMLLGPLRDAGVEVTLLKTTDIVQAYGGMYTGMMLPEPTYRHTGGMVLTGAMAEAQVRNVSGSTTWRRAGSADVSPLLSVCWAAHGLTLPELRTTPPPAPRRVTGGDAASRGATADLASASF